MQPTSNVLSLLTFHFCPTTWLHFLASTFAIATVGRYHAIKFGSTRFATVFGVSALGAATGSAISIRNDASAATAGGWGAASGLLAYHIMKHPDWFRNYRFATPALMFTALMLFALYRDDKAMLGGMTGGYLALLACL